MQTSDVQFGLKEKCNPDSFGSPANLLILRFSMFWAFRVAEFRFSKILGFARPLKREAEKWLKNFSLETEIRGKVSWKSGCRV